MPFSRRNRTFQKRDKHEVTYTALAENAGSQKNVPLLIVVPVADKDTSTECSVGSHVNGIYCEINIAAQTTTNPKTVHWTVEMFRLGETLANSNTYYQPSRSRVLKRGLEMLPSDQSTVYKRMFFVALPKGRLQDNINVNFRYIASSTETINTCGFFIYKELY